jgi:hypothetical protein
VCYWKDTRRYIKNDQDVSKAVPPRCLTFGFQRPKISPSLIISPSTEKHKDIFAFIIKVILHVTFGLYASHVGLLRLGQNLLDSANNQTKLSNMCERTQPTITYT